MFSICGSRSVLGSQTWHQPQHSTLCDTGYDTLVRTHSGKKYTQQSSRKNPQSFLCAECEVCSNYLRNCLGVGYLKISPCLRFDYLFELCVLIPASLPVAVVYSHIHCDTAPIGIVEICALTKLILFIFLCRPHSATKCRNGKLN